MMSLEQSSFSEANSSTASQKIARFTWNTKIYNVVYKSLLLVFIERQISQFDVPFNRFLYDPS
jgi:hypothetical protein